MSGVPWRARCLLVGLLGLVPAAYAVALTQQWFVAAGWTFLDVVVGAAVWRANAADEARVPVRGARR